jgi:hypothetical protein
MIAAQVEAYRHETAEEDGTVFKER